jgi:hypothetical protein
VCLENYPRGWTQARGLKVNQKQIECKYYANEHVVLLIALFSWGGGAWRASC